MVISADLSSLCGRPRTRDQATWGGESQTVLHEHFVEICITQTAKLFKTGKTALGQRRRPFVGLSLLFYLADWSMSPEPTG